MLLLAVAGGLSLAAATVRPLGVERLPDGNTLIVDCGRTAGAQDARALEVDSLGRLVWAYLKSDVPFLHTARRLPNGNTLMSASYGDRVVEADRRSDTVWTMATGLHYPNEAYRLANGNTLITDRDNNRVIEVTTGRQIVWSYTSLNAPHNGNRLANGNTLISDSDNNRIIEVDSSGAIVWQYSTNLNWPRSAERLENGNTLIAVSSSGRVIEVDGGGAIVWSVSNMSAPYIASRLANGNTLISNSTLVIELTPTCSLAWQYPNTVTAVAETLWVTNPSSGCSLHVHIHRPADAGPNNRVPAVVFAPDRNGYGSQLDSTGLPDDIASEGFAFLHFDPDGRGQSSPYPENYDGHVHQDGMHACLSLLASQPYVDTSRLGVYTRRYGITMGSGMIARHPEPHVKFLLDLEGPADRYQTCQDSGGHVPLPPENDSFWQEREAARFMKQVTSAYLRVQTEADSNPRIADNRHCIQLIDSATASVYGGSGISVWTRVNGSVMNSPNQVYSVSDPPAWIPEKQEVQNDIRLLLYLHELADMDLAVATTERSNVCAAAVPLRLTPRPCRDLLRVGLPPGPSRRELRVHDVLGRPVLRADMPAGSPRAELDLRDLRPGVYWVSADGAGTVPVVVVR